MSQFPPARPPKGKRKGGGRKRKPKTIRTHVPTASGSTTWDGTPICDCGSVWTARVHAVPETHPDAAEIDARRLGESE